ncbi:MAG: hypothetical protein ACR2JB_05980 [Bryobacteraceae bacterium]
MWEAATPAERAQLRLLLVKKAGNAYKTLPPDQQLPDQQPVVLQQLRGGWRDSLLLSRYSHRLRWRSTGAPAGDD